MAIPWNIPESSGQFDQKRIQKTIYPFLFSNKRNNFKFFFLHREREREEVIGGRKQGSLDERSFDPSPLLFFFIISCFPLLLLFHFLLYIHINLLSIPFHYTQFYFFSLSLSLSLSLIIYFLGKPKVSNPHIIIIPFKSTNPFDKNANTIWEIVA